MMNQNTIPHLGVGISFRSSISSHIFQNKKQIQFLEIIADHYLDATAEKMEELEYLKSQFSIIPHAVNTSLGSAELPDSRYIEKLAGLIEYINPPYWSEHISFSKINGIEIGHLSPIPYTQEAIDTFSENVAFIQKTISKPLVLENISYLVNIPQNEMKEEEFIRNIIEQTQCGLLLDLTNLVYNAANNHYSIPDFLNTIPANKIVQFHFTGGVEKWDKWIDNHSSCTPPEVWEWMKKIKSEHSVKGAILERDDAFPNWEEIATDLAIANTIMNSSH